MRHGCQPLSRKKFPGAFTDPVRYHTALRFADFITDTELIRQARSLADQVFREDPDPTGLHRNLHPFIAENAAPQGAH